MRRNDFFKYLIFGGGGSASRSELETETLPYTFNSNSYKLRNYRIYGNTVDGESVGDLVTEGDHAGEYLVPVTVEGKNLANIYTDIIPMSFTGIVSENPCVKLDNPRTKGFYLKCMPNTTYTLSRKTVSNNRFSIGFSENIPTLSGVRLLSFTIPLDSSALSLTATSPQNANYICCYLSNQGDNITEALELMLEKNTTTTPYEPYQIPITTNLYLPEQIKMVGDEAEYIDFREQKQHFADGTSADVTLPAIPILSGTNTLSVGTTVQPSKVYLQGKISEAETVSAEPVQTNVQSLQPLSLDNDDLQLDVMPIDRSEFQINDISEVPVEDENSVEEIPEMENFETSGDEENAE